MKIKAASRLKAYLIDMELSPEDRLKDLLKHLRITAKVRVTKLFGQQVPECLVPLSVEEASEIVSHHLSKPHVSNHDKTTVIQGQGLEFIDDYSRIYTPLYIVLTPYDNLTKMRLMGFETFKFLKPHL